MLDQTFGLLDHHLGHLHMAACRLVESRGNDFTAYGALHFRDLFRALVNQQNDQCAFGLGRGDRVGDLLQHHGLPGLRRRDQQAALALADRRNDVDGPSGQVLGRTIALLKPDTLIRVQRGEVFKENFLLGFFGGLVVDGFNFQQREVTLGVLRRTHQARNRVTGPQSEAADLTG